MKRIIDGKRYDTDTAELVAEWGNNLGVRDFRDVAEDLYVTKNGNFFIHGIGGPLTRWARSVGGNGRIGGEDILPLSPDEAREWLEAHGETDAIEEHFSDTVEDA